MKVPDGYIEKLIDEYHDVLVKMCKRIVHYDPYYMHMIDDCLQEVFVKASMNYDSLQKSENVLGWLVLCCVHYFKPYFRKAQRRKEIIGVSVSYEQSEDVADPMNSIIRWLKKMDALDTLADLKGQLTELEANVFHSYYEENLSMKQTAQKCHITIGSVRAAVERIRKKLSKMPLFILFLFYSVIR